MRVVTLGPVTLTGETVERPDTIDGQMLEAKGYRGLQKKLNS